MCVASRSQHRIGEMRQQRRVRGEVRELLKAVDTDESGEIDFEEFCLLEIMLSGCKSLP